MWLSDNKNSPYFVDWIPNNENQTVSGNEGTGTAGTAGPRKGSFERKKKRFMVFLELITSQ